MLMLGWVLGLGLGPQQGGLRTPDELTTFMHPARRECGTLAFFTGKPIRFQSRRPTCSKSSQHLLPESYCEAGFALDRLGDVTRAARGDNNDQRWVTCLALQSVNDVPIAKYPPCFAVVFFRAIRYHEHMRGLKLQLVEGHIDCAHVWDVKQCY